MSDGRSCDNRSQAASLGCGTLILIGLIVLFFGNLGDADLGPLEAEVAALRTEVEQLREQQLETHALMETMVLHLEVGAENGELGAGAD